MELLVLGVCWLLLMVFAWLVFSQGSKLINCVAAAIFNAKKWVKRQPSKLHRFAGYSGLLLVAIFVVAINAYLALHFMPLVELILPNLVAKILIYSWCLFSAIFIFYALVSDDFFGHNTKI